MAVNFMPFARKMGAAGASDIQVESFRRNYLQAFESGKCYIHEDDIAPVGSVHNFMELPQLSKQRENELLKRCAVLKLNGGLATTMGLKGTPKSLVRVKGTLSFLDITILQIRRKRAKIGARFLPLILMNSFNTSAETMSCITNNRAMLEQSVPMELMQSRVPRINADTLEPYTCSEDPNSEWCPPGHGDIYMSLYSTSLLAELLSNNIRYVFLSNIDNLGASLDARIPALMEERRCPFLMEVSRRCETDKKGGHLARDVYGGYVLRESSMCTPEDRQYFSDIDRYRYFNTNNIWFDVEKMYRLVIGHNGLLNLPVIKNSKILGDGQKIFQLETACGSAISLFEDAIALEVPRSRFAPVKGLSDLLAVRSDAYVMREDNTITLADGKMSPPVIVLPEQVKTIESMEAMFPCGIPSLVNCDRLQIEGPVIFGKDVRCVGEVKILANSRAVIEDGSVLQGEVVI
ncbi:UTP--glucose-1-phosphate uridylyltransferase [bacterium]|nr:UTP--glucose-1-phosphate uridylyltransferase [bacterium]